MNIHFIKSREKKRITQYLQNQFGITDLPYLLIESGKERIRAFSGHLSKEEILQLNKLTNIELIGIYFIKKESQKEMRLTLDATHLLKDQITKNIIELTELQMSDWLRGHDLNVQHKNGSFIIKYPPYFLGYGKSIKNKILNFIPKNRRLKNKLFE